MVALPTAPTGALVHSTVSESPGQSQMGGSPPAASPVPTTGVTRAPLRRIAQTALPAPDVAISTATWVTRYSWLPRGVNETVAAPAALTVAALTKGGYCWAAIGGYQGRIGPSSHGLRRPR